MNREASAFGAFERIAGFETWAVTLGFVETDLLALTKRSFPDAFLQGMDAPRRLMDVSLFAWPPKRSRTEHSDSLISSFSSNGAGFVRSP